MQACQTFHDKYLPVNVSIDLHPLIDKSLYFQPKNATQIQKKKKLIHVIGFFNICFHHFSVTQNILI